MQQSGYPVSVMLLAHDEVLSPHTDAVILGEVTAKPLTLDDWFKYEKGHPLAVEITGRVEEGSNTSKPDSPAIGSRITRSLQLDPAIRSESICLVDGGWLPLIYCLSGTNIFVDRNIVAEIKARFVGGKLKSGGMEERDFLNMLEQKACSSTLNPLPYALEGNVQNLPDVDVVLDQLRIALADLAHALPHIQVWPKSLYDREQTQATLGSYHAYFAQGMDFLQRVGPSLMATTGKAKRRAAWARIIQAAKDTGIPPQHICVAITLSALTASQKFNPAKNVLKPAAVYGEAQAYNAMWDLFLLFLLRQFQSQHPEYRPALLTRDKNLAFLWMGMNIQRSVTKAGEKQQVVFDERLMHCDPGEVEFLQALLGTSNIGYAS
ncbi:hypothetical protein SAMN05444064_1012 [Pseudomonas syringae]|uniref:hypothetical protein n=1 Tax=Pseudomonas syringae TaxID=317 RepID=UPI00089519A7|nr:hypothetical protein [Pseudomonas syringae]SDW00041.1 hypothetical protein SAMN05444514_1014 [Pseudomonas syringae]SFL34381.1 hypothetical protein SAMN05444064_1012 [Pseudomonas syringae]